MYLTLGIMFFKINLKKKAVRQIWKSSEYESSLEDFGFWNKCGSLYVLGSKIMLEHSHALLLHVVYGGICVIMAELNSYDRDCTDPKVLNYLLSIPL